MMSFSLSTLPLTFPPIQSFNLLFHSQNVSFPRVNVSQKLMLQYLIPNCAVRDFLRHGLSEPAARTFWSALSPDLHLLPF